MLTMSKLQVTATSNSNTISIIMTN